MVNVKEPDTEFAAFWDARLELAMIRDFAHSRMAPSWGVLGGVLAKAIAVVPPNVVLPAIVGSEASLNLFVGIVGKSGTGKGVSDAVSDELLPYLADVMNIGSGEGISHMYGKKFEKSVARVRYNVLMNIPEIDTLDGINGRKGSTILPEVRKAWMGESLGFQYADEKKRIPIDRHSYRMSLIAGIQPERADVLLNDVDGGTPQRFVWLPGYDPTIPLEMDYELASKLKLNVADDWKLSLSRDYYESELLTEVAEELQNQHVFSVCDIAVKEIRQHRHARVTGLASDDDGDGHRLLAQEKVAAAISVVSGDEPGVITDEDWQLAGTVMTLSKTIRNELSDAALQRQQEANRIRGRQEAERSLIVETKTHEHHVNRVADVMRRKLEKVPNATDGQLRKALQSTDRKYADEALKLVRR